jgi:hypothetical protein
MMVVQSMADMFECSNNLAPLGSARGATLGSDWGAMLGSAQTVRRAKPRREIQCIYLHPSASLGVHSASLGVHSASLGVHSASLKLFVERSRDEKSNAYTPTPRLRSGCNPSAPLGVQCSALIGVQCSAPLGVQSKRNSHCPGKCSFYPNIFTHSPTCVHMKSASGTSV